MFLQFGSLVYLHLFWDLFSRLWEASKWCLVCSHPRLPPWARMGPIFGTTSSHEKWLVLWYQCSGQRILPKVCNFCFVFVKSQLYNSTVWWILVKNLRTWYMSLKTVFVLNSGPTFMHRHHCHVDGVCMRRSKHHQNWQELLTGTMRLNRSLYNIIECSKRACLCISLGAGPQLI